MAASKDFGGGGGESTIIGPSILINGKLSGDEDLTVRGREDGVLPHEAARQRNAGEGEEEEREDSREER